MKIKFDLANLKVDLGHALQAETREWWLRNCKIPPDTTNEQFTEEHKQALVRLAIYENLIENEDLANHRDIRILP